MVPALPARCTQCAHVFTPRGGIYIENSTGGFLSNNSVTCPKCNGRALLIEGRMNFRDGGIEMLSGPQWSWDVVQELRLTLARVVLERPEDPIADVEAVAPELGKDLRRVTQGWTTERVIALISGILGILSFAGVDVKNSTVAVGALMQTVADYVSQAAG